MIDSTFMDRQNEIQEERDWDEAVDEFMARLEFSIDGALDVLPPTLVVGMLETVKIGMMFGEEEED
jgi:hypothetical protein|tara:strand:- start:199 stop:396 length:198 start_codon:yes stop_codon:yes gene_type:complete